MHWRYSKRASYDHSTRRKVRDSRRKCGLGGRWCWCWECIWGDNQMSFIKPATHRYERRKNKQELLHPETSGD